jgi:large subunit ribosomal protein L10
LATKYCPKTVASRSRVLGIKSLPRKLLNDIFSIFGQNQGFFCIANSKVEIQTEKKEENMAISRKNKEELVAKITTKIKESKSIVFADYKGLTVEEIGEIRSELRKQGLEMKVIKQSLFTLAAKEAGAEIETKSLKGHPIAYVFSNDEVMGAKTIYDFSKKNEKLEMVGGSLNGKSIAMEELKVLATMPSRDEMYAKIVGSLASPLRGMVGVLQGNLRGLVSVLNQYSEQRSK